jgi:acetyl-CoA C-acetyltransferase
VERLLKKQGKTVGDFDLFENNEAFALNSILFSRRLEIDLEKLNVNGGAIALGHPIGCSGARILVTLLHALRRRDLTAGVAAICHGTGGGTVTAIERL